MLYNNLSLIMRSVMIQAAFLGFFLGFSFAFYFGETTLAMALFRGAALCFFFTWCARKLMLTLFRYYLVQYELRDSR